MIGFSVIFFSYIILKLLKKFFKEILKIKILEIKKVKVGIEINIKYLNISFNEF